MFNELKALKTIKEKAQKEYSEASNSLGSIQDEARELLGVKRGPFMDFNPEALKAFGIVAGLISLAALMAIIPVVVLPLFGVFMLWTILTENNFLKRWTEKNIKAGT